jgi:hypothetical protein
MVCRRDPAGARAATTVPGSGVPLLWRLLSAQDQTTRGLIDARKAQVGINKQLVREDWQERLGLDTRSPARLLVRLA